MGLIICLLIIIIFMLSFYIILVKEEIKRVSKQLITIKNGNSNTLLNKELDDKSMNDLIVEINTLIKSINEKERRIYLKDQSLQKMITNIAHDLRTPLTSALGYIDILKNEKLTNSDKKKYISIIQERLNKLSYLITNFFEFSKSISKNEEIKLMKENLVEIIENSIINFYEDFSKENRKIDFESVENRIEIITNKSLITRIFDNLIYNAYKHSNSDLKIRVKKVENKINIEFENKTEDDLLDIESIFDEFFTSDISRTKGNTGLGLAIAKEFAGLLGANIWAEKVNNKFKIKMII